MAEIGTFQPDNLIAGNAELMTESVRIPSGTLVRDRKSVV